MFLLLILEPYIDAGLVHLIPDFSDLNEQFRHDVWEMAKERPNDFELDEVDAVIQKELLKDDVLRGIRGWPDHLLRSSIKNQSPGIADEQVDQIVSQIKKQQEADPIALLQPTMLTQDGAPLHFIKSFNLESAMFLAGFTGAVIYTDIPLLWKHLHEHTKTGDLPSPIWETLTERLKDIEFPLECNWRMSLQNRTSGKLGKVRSVIRHIGNAAYSKSEIKHILEIVEHLTRELGEIEISIQKELPLLNPTSSSSILFRGKLKLSIPAFGFEMNTVRRLLLTYGRVKQMPAIPMALFINVDRPNLRNSNNTF